jgi:cell division septation protein DedD
LHNHFRKGSNVAKIQPIETPPEATPEALAEAPVETTPETTDAATESPAEVVADPVQSTQETPAEATAEASPQPSGEPSGKPAKYIVQAQYLGPWTRGDILTAGQLKAANLSDDRILDLQLQGLLLEQSD